jgi:hypothetical protein
VLVTNLRTSFRRLMTLPGGGLCGEETSFLEGKS